MQPLKHVLLTSTYTKIYHDELQFHAPHYFVVHDVDNGNILTEVKFQKGPVKESGVNGVHNEDLIHMILARLQGFQASPYACRENELAIQKLEEALMWLRYRTNSRKDRGVEGTYKL